MKGRVYFIDVAKVITAFLVVFTHLYTSDDPFRQWVYSFHMPLFFLLSGMFHKEYSIVDTTYKNTRRLIIPALFFMACGLCTYVCIYGIDSFLPILKQSIYGMVAGEKIPGNNVIWFLFALFWCNIFLNLMLRYKWTIFPMLLAYVVVVAMFHFRWLHLSQAMFAMPFYVIGYYMNKLDFSQILSSGLTWKKRAVMAVGGILLIISIPMSGLHPDVSMHFSNPGAMASVMRYPLFYINGMIGTLGVVLCSASLPTIRPDFIEKCSRGLISILGLQYLFMLVWDEFVGRNQPYHLSFFAAIAIMVICLCCNALLEKYIPIVIGKQLKK